MSEGTKRGLWVLGSALVLGIVGNALVRVGQVGLNLLLWIGAIAAGYVLLSRKFGQLGEGRWFLIPAVLFAGGMVWRASPMLQVLDLLAVLISLALAMLYARSGAPRKAGLISLALGMMWSAANALIGLLPLVFSDIQWKEFPRTDRSARVAAIVRGLLIALPLLLLFGGLMISADAVFAKIAGDLASFDVATIVSHLVLTGVFTGLIAGLLRMAFLEDVTKRPSLKDTAPFSLGFIEMGTVLGLLNVLFFSFVLVQFQYFFGGNAVVLESTGLTYAEYARRGFFELVWISALVLPLLLLGHWLLPEGRPAQERTYRWLSGSLVAMLFVIMASAVQRMFLYQQEYGLTELRLYTTAFMGWLALLFVAFLLTVLRGRRERFIFSGLMTGFAVLIGLHVANPDALIARTNIQLAVTAQRELDVNYIARLSADSVPVIVEALPGLTAYEQDQAKELILRHWEARQLDWRGWNWGRVQAMEAVRK